MRGMASSASFRVTRTATVAEPTPNGSRPSRALEHDAERRRVRRFRVVGVDCATALHATPARGRGRA